MKTELAFLAAGMLLGAGGTGLSQQPTFTRITNGAIVNDQGNFGGATWGNFSNRGLLDLLVCDFRGGTNVFYRNNGDGTFTKITNLAPVRNAAYSVMPAAADFGNDGYLDLLISAGGAAPTPQPNMLYHNNGDGAFTPFSGGGVTNLAGFYNGCGVADYDNDGFVDLFIPGVNGQSLLFHNNGDGTFRRVLSGSIVTDFVSNSSLAWVDYDDDGFMDMFIAHAEPTRSYLYHNNRDGTFTRVLTNAVVTDSWPDGGWGAAWGDYDNDGLPDLFVTGMTGVNRLYHNNGNGAFTNVTTGPMLAASSSRSCAWGDYDNDGYLDLFVASYNAPNRLFHNNGDGAFTQVVGAVFANDPNSGIYCQSCGWVDYDNDGFLDLFVARAPDNGTTSNLLYHNNGNTNAWLEVKLVGTVANRSAIGAKVRVHATIGGKTFWQLREINSGQDRSIQPLIAHFGLGDATNVDTLRIEWPSGTVQELHDLTPRQILSITEPPRLLASITNGLPQFSLKAWPGMEFDIQASTDLAAWSPVATVTITNLSGIAQIIDTNAPALGSRFYRASSR